MGTEIEVWMDGGIRSGQDVLKARALGARGTLIGRAFLCALAAYGEAGAPRCLTRLSSLGQYRLPNTRVNRCG
ncbi:hypothetical protein Tamer19_70150 [Cupriavidus sp. TA19]|nr:hypothetical protein Tamer19_70150 [Cupriavidus sp. TA19]